MKGTPENARVVYAEIQSDALQKIADSITDVFIQSGSNQTVLYCIGSSVTTLSSLV